MIMHKANDLSMVFNLNFYVNKLSIGYWWFSTFGEPEICRTICKNLRVAFSSYSWNEFTGGNGKNSVIVLMLHNSGILKSICYVPVLLVFHLLGWFEPSPMSATADRFSGFLTKIASALLYVYSALSFFIALFMFCISFYFLSLYSICSCWSTLFCCMCFNQNGTNVGLFTLMNSLKTRLIGFRCIFFAILSTKSYFFFLQLLWTRET